MRLPSPASSGQMYLVYIIIWGYPDHGKAIINKPILYGTAAHSCMTRARYESIITTVIDRMETLNAP